MARTNGQVLMPIIAVSSVDDIHSFDTDKLGFHRVMGVMGEDGKLGMVTLALDGAGLIFARPRAKMEGTQPSTAKRPVEIYMGVVDVDAYHTQLRERNVTISDPLTFQWWGDKTFNVTDPYGYEIWFGQKVGEPDHLPGVKIV